ncbi:simple sugar transport system permease protein [Clostridium saccharoperbutylacetonicum]|uniref:Monosaccharide ABC transporter membrane protein, CUT2 family n=1 Tax=Clostridium saccharoperbutylacetonicum N1-4(HMT) TaxID=931276 RepID=M1MKI2_9CLOT|nr:galactofuranose ABC transporter, permease protein YjfF [Clostridium saccharoperbutylacetonicum]AGF58449.1 monosaccharide ABC transporter membrane protein, CUT2 family [Clostridium saccharoperbutylacetonicum N1-4(HMT)]NRT60773.1 simple sugar transport system permease protein [Clostridium saccharoperbutylacetonicum]NSB24087.1 simple sugar transport system permease protein [Clostridium saccharoperbutylacetonicum]NSB43465.1 simple sugar transport system permease protein [Clostridium saccharoperb
MNKKSLLKLNKDYIAIYATIVLFISLFLIGSILYNGFLSPQVFSNLFIDNAYLIVIAIGEAVAILTGGIDLSVGAMIAFVSMITASLLQKGVNPVLVILIVLIVGIVFGTVQGILIQKFNLHPWIVTLAGMFFARGASYIISIDTIMIDNPLFIDISSYRISILPDAFISINVIVSLMVVAGAFYMLKFTRFGRTVYAIGGNENSAKLMGLPVERTKILVYTFSGFCSALGGLLFTIYTLSGYGLHCNGTEMDAIAACVIGGILLTGGYGNIIGPLFGVLTTGIIQSLIMFDGTLNSWWTKIAVGMLLFMFIVLQRIIVIRDEKRKSALI